MSRSKISVINVKLSVPMLEQIDDVLKAGFSITRSEFIRSAISRMLLEERGLIARKPLIKKAL